MAAAPNRRITVPGGVKIEQMVVEEGNELVSWKRFMRRWTIATAGAIWSSKEGGGNIQGSENDAQKEAREEKEKVKIADEEFMKGSALVTAMGKVGFECLDEWDLEPSEVSFSALVKRFEDRFARQQTALVNRHRIMRLEQGQGEMSAQFFTRIKNLTEIGDWGSNKAEFQDRLMVTVGIAGLNDEELRTNLLTEQTLDWGAMKTRCDQWEAARVTTKVMGKPEFEEVAAVTMNEEKRRQGDRERGPIQCYDCKGYGHIARNCDKKICYKCNGMGHISFDCPKKYEGGQEKRPMQRSKPKVVCSYCDKTGHGESTCYAKQREEKRGSGQKQVGAVTGRESYNTESEGSDW